MYLRISGGSIPHLVLISVVSFSDTSIDDAGVRVATSAVVNYVATVLKDAKTVRFCPPAALKVGY